MKKVFLSFVAIALFGFIALSSCKSGAPESTADTTPVIEEPAPQPEPVVDTAVVDTTVVAE